MSSARPGSFARLAPAGLASLLLLAACSGDGAATGPDAGPPPGPDTSSPFPLDRGDDGASTPGKYKGLPLRLTDNGAPNVTAVDGVVGLACVGMSNANQECSTFITAVRDAWAGQVSTQVRVANCAVGSHAVERWMDPAYDSVLWDDCAARKLPAAGIRPDQVRVLWHKAANQFTTGPGGARLPTYPDPACDTGVTNASGVCWDRADFVDDGVHPSSAGRAKVAQMLHERLKKEAWYRR